MLSNFSTLAYLYAVTLLKHIIALLVILIKLKKKVSIISSQLTFTYSKSIIEILEKGVKYVQSYQ